MSEPPQLLLVDDEPELRDILVDWLTPRGYRVATAGDAEQALARLGGERFDALVLDLHLPGRDGLEVLEAARRRDPELAILIMTGFATADSAIEALRQQVDDYLQKPFDMQALMHALGRALERRRLRQENRQLVAALRAANHELDRRVEAKTRSLRTLLEITHQLTGTLDLDQALEHIAGRARELTGAGAALLFLRSGADYVLEVATGVDPGGDPARIAAARRIALATAESGAAWRRPAPPPPLASALAVPLLWEGRTIGVLVLIDRPGAARADGSRPGVPFGSEAEDLALGLAAHAAVAIRNAQIYEEARRLDRLQSAFIAAVSHELRTPLTGMKAPLEILAAKYGQSLNDAGRQMLRICRESAERLEDLVELILFSAESGETIDRSRFEPVEISALVREAVQRIEGVAAHKQVPIQVELPATAGRVLAYRRGLVRVLVCLLSNAVKFSERGQAVRLEVEETATGRVALHIVDRGVGIDAADQPLIFRRFAQLDGSLTKRAGGTGLGLSVAQALVEQHGGEIRVESRVGAGSRFTVELPLAVAAAAPARPANARQARAA